MLWIASNLNDISKRLKEMTLLQSFYLYWRTHSKLKCISKFWIFDCFKLYGPEFKPILPSIGEALCWFIDSSVPFRILFTSTIPDDMILSNSSSVLFDSSLMDFKNWILSSVQLVYENNLLKSKINSQTPRLLWQAFKTEFISCLKSRLKNKSFERVISTWKG